MQALLAAFMNPPADEAAFNAWYDEEHVPLRLGVPGFLTARRYKKPVTDKSQGPRYLALYDLASTDVLQSPEYKHINTERSERERDMLARIPLMQRRVFELLLDGADWSTEPPYQMTVAMTPPPGGEDDYVAWYRDEHIRMLLAVPGWRRARLYRQIEGDGPSFMAVHELESPDVFDRREYELSISTPWRERIRSSVLRYERNLFKLWRAFR